MWAPRNDLFDVLLPLLSSCLHWVLLPLTITSSNLNLPLQLLLIQNQFKYRGHFFAILSTACCLLVFLTVLYLPLMLSWFHHYLCCCCCFNPFAFLLSYSCSQPLSLFSAFSSVSVLICSYQNCNKPSEAKDSSPPNISGWGNRNIWWMLMELCHVVLYAFTQQCGKLHRWQLTVCWDYLNMSVRRADDRTNEMQPDYWLFFAICHIISAQQCRQFVMVLERRQDTTVNAE